MRHLQTLGPSERAAVYSTSGRVSVPFTADRELLTRTLQSIASLNRQRAWTEPSLRCAPMTFYRAYLVVANDPGALRDCAGPPITDPTAESARLGKLNDVMVDAESVLDLSLRDP